MIRKSRLKKNLTQKEIAKKLKTNQSYISRLENKSVHNFDLKVISDLAKILDLDFNELIYWLMN